MGVHNRGDITSLVAKEYVASDSSVVPYVYHAAVTRDKLLNRRLKNAANELCDGRAVPLILALVQGNQFSADELTRLRQLLDATGRLTASRKPKS